jgi:hypothetical protein
MSVSIPGHVQNGVVVPNSPLPEGAKVEIRLDEIPTDPPAKRQDQPATESGQVPGAPLTPGELRNMPREQRQAFLSAAAQMAEEDYHFDKDLTDFEAFIEEELDDDKSDSC